MRHIIAILLALLLPLITKAQLTGVWEAKFGSSPEEAIEAIKTKTHISPANVESYGKITVVAYGKCVVDNQAYAYIMLQFFDKHLCGGELAFSGGSRDYEALIEKYRQRYGAPGSNNPKLTGWSFGKDCTMLISYDNDKGIIATNFFLEPGYTQYGEELKNLPDDTPNTATAENAASPAAATAKNDASLKELTGFWGIKFGQSPETVINTLKTTKKYIPSKRVPEGKATSLYYSNCTFGPDKCTEVFLTFYNNKLCGTIFTIPSTPAHTKGIIKAMQDKYGPAKQTKETNGAWNFKDGNGLLVHMTDDQTAEVFYSNDENVEEFAKERTKNKSADY